MRVLSTALIISCLSLMSANATETYLARGGHGGGGHHGGGHHGGGHHGGDHHGNYNHGNYDHHGYHGNRYWNGGAYEEGAVFYNDEGVVVPEVNVEEEAPAAPLYYEDYLQQNPQQTQE